MLADTRRSSTPTAVAKKGSTEKIDFTKDQGHPFTSIQEQIRQNKAKRASNDNAAKTDTILKKEVHGSMLLAELLGGSKRPSEQAPFEFLMMAPAKTAVGVNHPDLTEPGSTSAEIHRILNENHRRVHIVELPTETRVRTESVPAIAPILAPLLPQPPITSDLAKEFQGQYHCFAQLTLFV